MVTLRAVNAERDLLAGELSNYKYPQAGQVRAWISLLILKISFREDRNTPDEHWDIIYGKRDIPIDKYNIHDELWDMI